MKLSRISLFFFVPLAAAQTISAPIGCKQGLQEIQAHRYAEAVAPLTQCMVGPLPPAARAHILEARARARGELKQWNAAAVDQSQSIALARPLNVWAYVMLGAYLREDGQYEDALKALRRALDFDEDGPGTGPGMAVHYHTAKTLHQAGRYSDAIETMTAGIPKQPGYGYALYQRGLSYEKLGDNVQAKRDFFRAAELVSEQGYEPEIAMKLEEYGFVVKILSDSNEK